MTDDDTETDLAWLSGVLAAATKPPWRAEAERALSEHDTVAVCHQGGESDTDAEQRERDAAAIAALGSVGRELLAVVEAAQRVEYHDHARCPLCEAAADLLSPIRHEHTCPIAALDTALRAARERAR